MRVCVCVALVCVCVCVFAVLSRLHTCAISVTLSTSCQSICPLKTKMGPVAEPKTLCERPEVAGICIALEHATTYSDGFCVVKRITP
jgi:hypothetical protein